MRYGYVRVSTEDQNEGRQVEKMAALGIDHVFVDKASGKSLDRPAWKQLRAIVEPGDEIVIDSLDRLGRNYDEVTAEWRRLTREEGVDICALDLDFMNSAAFRAMGEVGKLLEDMVLNLLAWVAQTERDKIKQRQREGIDAALARGQKFGHPFIEVPEEFGQIHVAFRKKEIRRKDAADALNVSMSTFDRWVKRAECGQ